MSNSSLRLCLFFCLLVVATAVLIFFWPRTRFSEKNLAEDQGVTTSAESSNGFSPSLSPNGKKVAFVRLELMPDWQDIRGNPVHRPDVWVHDLTDGSEKRVAENTTSVGWFSNSAIKLRKGMIFDTVANRVVSDMVQLPEKLSVKNVQWAPDGKQLVYLPDVNFYKINNMNVSNTGRSLYVLDSSGRTRELALGPAIDTDDNGFLDWSPDAKFISFHLLFFRNGEVPIRRIGVIEVTSGSVHFVGEGAYCHYNWGLQRTEFAHSAPNPWDAKGKRFLFVTGRGDGDADVYLSRFDASNTQRLTKDGCCKWSPQFDPSGRRVAFCAADWGGGNGTLRNGSIRVLDLLTGKEEKFNPESADSYGTLAWFPDGSGLIYAFEINEKRRIGQIKFPLPVTVPEGTPEKTVKPGDQKSQILDALASDKPAIIEWGAERAAQVKDPEVVAALRKALKSAPQHKDHYPVREILDALVELNARDAVPEIIGAFGSNYGPDRCTAISVISGWKEKSALPALREILRKTPDGVEAVYAAGALANLGEDDVWPLLQKFASDPNKDRRNAVASLLRNIRDARSVEILIQLVEDKERLYWDYTGEVQVGDHALKSLATLSGVTFGRDRAAWANWWRQQAGHLPEINGANKALEELRKLDEQKGIERQKQFNK